jgi:hypothetical protein
VDAAYAGSPVATGEFSLGEVSVAEPQSPVFSGFSLEQNYPNPVSRETTISYSLNAEVPVSLTLYNIEGKEVIRLVDESKPAGRHVVVLNAEKLSNGIYFYKLQTGRFSQSKKMTVIH